MTVAVVFPGQGSQSVGMLAELAAAEPIVGETFAEAHDVLGTDLWALAQAGPAEALADTRVTQPLMFVADIAVWRALRANGLAMPAAVAGHSLGEFAALVASNAIPFADALRLVERRATLMAGAVPDGEGGMAALIGMDDDAVVALLRGDGGGARRGPGRRGGQLQRAGAGRDLGAPRRDRAGGRRREGQGARKALVLPVSVPNHSSLMQGAGEELANAIDALDWAMPDVPLVQNEPAEAPGSLDELLARLRLHVSSPVRWTRCVETLRDVHGATLVLEAGPGKVLAGLGKRIDRSLTTLPVESPETLAAALEAASTAANETNEGAGA